MLNVTGEENLDVYSGQQIDEIYLPEGGAVQEIESSQPAAPVARTKADRIDIGSRLYSQNCAACHQPEGQGLTGAFPPLAGSDYLLTDTGRAINGVINGISGEIIVNGTTYNGVMPAVRLSDEEVANVLTYVLNAWSNDGGEVSPQDVQGVRSQE